ncbi:MAG: saccharopine dehydrogenase family protein [Nitrososphaerales archaeon]
MRVLVLGAGMQGRAALYDLSCNPQVAHMIAADANPQALAPFIKHLDQSRLEVVTLDAADAEEAGKLMDRVDAVVALLPPEFDVPMLRLAIQHGAHFVTTSYALPELVALAKEAEARGLTVLTEFGFDPGIDLVLTGQAVRDLDEVLELFSYGAGFPEPVAANNPLKYKISWTWRGVLKAYSRPVRLVRDGQIVDLPGREIFAPENIHTIELPEWGTHEAYPNGNVVTFLERLGLLGKVRNAARYSNRWPGHCAFWYKMAQLGFLDTEPIQVGDARVAPRDFLDALLEPQLQYKDDERDVATLRIDVRGIKDGQGKRIVYELCDVRDLETGLMAMNRTTGQTAALGAQMILRGDISKRGLATPLADVPVDVFLQEMAARRISITRRDEAWQV